MRLISVLVLTSLFCAPSAAANIKLHLIDVGQGDGMVLECADGTLGLVVDSADSRESDGGLDAWKAYVQPFLDGVQSVPVVVASHPHADHIGGLAWLMASKEVDYLVDNGRDHDSATYRAYKAERNKLTVGGYDKAVPWPSEVTTCDGEVTITYWVAGGFTTAQCKRDPNLCSVFVRIDYGKTSFLLTGDAHDDSELALLADEGMVDWLDVDVLKVGHHGSYTSSHRSFLRVVSPTCALISAGDWQQSTTNRRVQRANGRWAGYGHPRVKTIRKLNSELQRSGNALRSRKIKAWNGSSDAWQSEALSEGLAITSLDGTAVVESDGEAVICPH